MIFVCIVPYIGRRTISISLHFEEEIELSSIFRIVLNIFFFSLYLSLPSVPYSQQQQHSLRHVTFLLLLLL
jgi:hypothetical protein